MLTVIFRVLLVQNTYFLLMNGKTFRFVKTAIEILDLIRYLRTVHKFVLNDQGTYCIIIVKARVEL